MATSEPLTRQSIVDEMIFVVPGLLTPEECADFIQRTEQMHYEPATVNTRQGAELRPSIRNNHRVIVDNPDWADWLWQRVCGLFPEQGYPRVLGLNERFRFYRYDPGEKFAPHFDGFYQRPGTKERSLYTCMVFLNDGFTGGQTRFHQYAEQVEPRQGMGLFFVHRQLHEGCPVLSGRKYVLRTDVMYDLSEHLASPPAP